MLDVTALVQQMRDTLSEIHDTITSLDTKGHDEKLDALESQRDEVFRQLQSAFEKESAELKQRRQAERDEIAEKRRREDEEIAARRRSEDEEKASRDHGHDSERQHKLESEKEGVEQETDEKMDRIEEEARRLLDEGHSKLKDLEEKRREINRMIDEQMKAPLPPPPARRARRSNRASQGGLPGQSDSDRQPERAAPLQAEPQDPTQKFDASASRGIESQESRDDEFTQAGPEPAEPTPEPISSEQALAEEKSPSRDEPQKQAAESVDLHDDPSSKPAGHEDQSQLPETPSESQPATDSDRGVAEAVAEDNVPAAHQGTGEIQQDSSSQAPVAPSSEESEQPATAASAGARSDVGEDVQKNLAEEELVDGSPDTKERELDSDGAREDTPSQIQDQASGAENQGIDISSDAAKQSAEPRAGEDPQEAPLDYERRDLSDQLATREARTTNKSAAEDESDQIPSQLTPDETAPLDGPAEHEGLEGSDHDDLFPGVVKGGAAEEYVRMAEAESGQEVQAGPDTSATPDQEDSSSGHGQHGDSSRGIEQPGSIQGDTSTTDKETSGYTRQAEADGRPSTASGPADSVEGKVRSPVGSEHESGHLQNRDIEGLDQQRPRYEPTLDPEKYLKSSSGQSELDHLRNPNSTSIGEEQPSAPSQDSLDAVSSGGEQMRETGHGEQPQSESGGESAVPAPTPQQRDLESTPPQETEVEKTNSVEASGSDKDPGDTQPAEDQQEPHDDEQRGNPSQAMRSGQEHPAHDMVSQFESDPVDQQGPSSSDLGLPAISSHDPQLGKDLGGNAEHGGFGAAESSRERQGSPIPEEEHASGDSGEKLPRASSHDNPSVVEPDDIDALPQGSVSEHETGDKRSDSGYETGMASSRNLEDSTTTLHEAQHAQGAEHSSASASLVREQENTREPRPEQILEGSGKDVSPPSLGGEQQDSGDHPAEETFDLSGSEPIPGTMTHGKDHTEDQGKELAGGDVSLRDMGQQPVDNDAAGAAPGDSERSVGIHDSLESPNVKGSLVDASSQHADDDHAQPESQPTAHEADNTDSADSRSQGTEGQLLQGDSKSPVGTVDQGASFEDESNSGPSDIAELQHQGSAPITGQAEKLHPEGDVKSTTSHRMDEPQQETPVGGDGTGAPTSQEQISEPSHVSYSSNAHGTGPDQFGSWRSQALSRPADDHEFSFKKRADSVQVGRSNGSADRGAELPSISTDGPNEDADEGLFAVPPTPRHEMDPDKPSQLQGDGESSRASSRNGATGGDTLSPMAAPPAAEGLRDSYGEESDRAPQPETGASRDDMHHDDSHSSDDGPQANAEPHETSDAPGEKTTVPHNDQGGSSNRGELDRERPEDPLIPSTGERPHEASAEHGDSQQGQHHDVVSLQASEEQPRSSDRQLDGSPQPETSSAEKHSDMTSNSDAIGDNGGVQSGPGNQAPDTSGDATAYPYGLTEEQDLEQDTSGFSHPGDPDQQPLDGANQRDEATEDFRPRDVTEPDSEPVRQESGDAGNRSSKDDNEVQQGEVAESRTFEGTPRSASPEVAEPASDQEVDKKNADPPELYKGGTQDLDSGSGLEGEQAEQDHDNIGNAAHQPSSPDRPSQHLDAQQVNYDDEGYGTTPYSEYSSDPLADSSAREQIDTHSADNHTVARQSHTHSYDLPDSAHATFNDDPMDSDSETFETPLESADFRKPQEDGRSVTPGNFTRALDRLPDESAHTVQGTDDLFEDTDDAEDQDDYGEAVVYRNSNEAAESSPSGEKTVYSTRGDENNTALGGHRSSLSLGSVGHRSQGSISSMRDTTPVRPTFGSYIGGPNIVRADWAAEYEDELRPPSSLNPTPQLGPSTTHDTPEISPFALRSTPMPSHGSEQKGLNSSMWNPERPQTPTSAATQSNNPFTTPQRQAESEFDPSLFAPRDVTHGRQDSVPASLHSQTTLDSSWSSPVHSSLPVDRHEPVIRDSWPAPAPGYQQYLSSWSSRPRGDTTSTAGEYDPFKPDNGGAPGGHTAVKPSSSYNPFLQRGRAESSVSAAPSTSSVSNSPNRGSALFAKMRNIFESQSPNGVSDVPASPGKTRPVSGVFHPVASAQRKSQDGATGQRDDERGGFLNEADHEIDERSAFLRSDGQPSGH